jgi:prevent-host-death family protein
MKTVNLYAAKTNLSKLVDEVESGKEIIIARNGRAVARLAPLETTSKVRKLGTLEGQVKIKDNFDDFEFLLTKVWSSLFC